MGHRPVCAKCETEFIPIKNGTVLVDVASYGDYKVWDTDMYECPKCHTRIVVGFPDNSYMEHFQKGFKEHIAIMEKEGLVVRNREFIEKESA